MADESPTPPEQSRENEQARENSPENTEYPTSASDRDRTRSRPRHRRVVRVLAVLALVPVTLLAILRVADIPSGITDTLVSFTPYALPVGLVAVLLAVVGRSLLIGLLSGVLTIGHLAWLAPMYVPDGPVVRGYSTTVMSTNLQYGHGDPERVVELVRENDVDILSVQELTPQAVDGLHRAGLDELLEHRHISPDPGTPEGTGIWSARPVKPAEFGNTQPMTFENIRATVGTRGGVDIDFLAVHPYPPFPSSSAAWRRDIGQLVRLGKPDDRPMVMAGDFNATRDHGPMRQLAEQGLVDAADQAGAGYVPTWGLVAPLSRMFEIDHVLVSDDDINATEVTRHVIDDSDHKAVVAELTISEETSSDPG